MGGKSRGRAGDVGAFANLGVSAIQQVGNVKRKAALRAFLRRNRDAGSVDAGTSELRVPVSELRDGCARLGCAWCVDSMLECEESEDAMGIGGSGAQDCTENSDLPAVRVVRESDADGGDIIVIHKGAGDKQTEATWIEQIVAFIADIFVEGAEGTSKSNRVAATDMRSMMQRATSSTRGAHAVPSRPDALRAAIAEKRAALEQIGSRLKRVENLLSEWKQDELVATAANDSIVHHWTLFSRNFALALIGSRKYEVTKRAFDNARISIVMGKRGNTSAVQQPGSKVSKVKDSELRATAEAAQKDMIKSKQELLLLTQSLLTAIDVTMERLDSFYASKAAAETGGGRYTRAGGEVHKARILYHIAQQELSQRSDADDVFVRALELAEKHRTELRKLVFTYFEDFMEAPRKVIIREIDSDDEEEEEEEGSGGDAAGHASEMMEALHDESSALHEETRCFADDIEVMEKKLGESSADGVKIASTIACALAVRGVCEEFLSEEADRAIKDLEQEEERRKEKLRLEKAREMERKLAVMAAKEEKHAQLMAKVNAEREKVSRKTVSFTVDGADDPIGIPPPRAAELCPADRIRLAKKKQEKRESTVLGLGELDDESEREFAQQLNQAIKESKREEEEKRKKAREDRQLSRFGEDKALPMAWPVKKPSRSVAADPPATNGFDHTMTFEQAKLPVNRDRFVDPSVSFLASVSVRESAPPPPEPEQSVVPEAKEPLVATEGSAPMMRAEGTHKGSVKSRGEMGQWASVVDASITLRNEHSPSVSSEPSDDMDGRWKEPVDETLNTSSDNNSVEEAPNPADEIDEGEHALTTKGSVMEMAENKERHQKKSRRSKKKNKHADAERKQGSGAGKINGSAAIESDARATAEVSENKEEVDDNSVDAVDQDKKLEEKQLRMREKRREQRQRRQERRRQAREETVPGDAERNGTDAGDRMEFETRCEVGPVEPSAPADSGGGKQFDFDEAGRPGTYEGVDGGQTGLVDTLYGTGDADASMARPIIDQPLELPVHSRLRELGVEGVGSQQTLVRPPVLMDTAAHMRRANGSAKGASAPVGDAHSDDTRTLLLQSLSRSYNEAQSRLHAASHEADRTFQMCMASDVDAHTKRAYVLLFTLEDTRKDVAAAECELSRLRFNKVANRSEKVGSPYGDLQNAERALAEARARESRAMAQYERHTLSPSLGVASGDGGHLHSGATLPAAFGFGRMHDQRNSSSNVYAGGSMPYGAWGLQQLQRQRAFHS